MRATQQKTQRQKLLDYHEVDDKTGCWNWTKTLSNTGYARISRSGKYDLAHRASYETFVGKIPTGLWVLHRCDNRRCINPAHLFLGTREDNVADMVAKGRQAYGERHGVSKLTATQVAAIRADSRKHREIAADYGVTYGLVGHIKRRLVWRIAPSA